MLVPKNKEELLLAIKDTYAKLQKDLVTIPPELTMLKELDGHAKGTKMSVCNLVAYLTGWGGLVLKWYALKNEGEEVDFPETGFKWNELGLLAQKFYEDYAELDFEALLLKLENVVKQILLLIEAHDNTELYEMPWYDKYTMGKMIQLNTSSPYKNARIRVRKWKRKKGL